MTTQTKQAVIADNQQHKTDTGSMEVTVALLSKRIDDLAEHLKIHKKDKHSRRGLIGLVSKRRKMLKYMMKKSPERYQALIKKLGLKR